MIQPFLPQSSPFDRIRRTRIDGSEYWAARELQPVMGYAAWRDFTNAVDRAKAACTNSGALIADHFADARKVSASGPDAEDFILTRYGAYLVAMNGDPRKREIAEAQTYFAVKTREAELREAFAVPQSFAEALELAARQARQLEEAENRALAAEHQALALAPAAYSWDVLNDTRGDVDFAQGAQVLDRDPNISMGRDRLFAFTDSIGWTYKHGKQPRRPYQTQVDLGRLTLRMPKTFTNRKTQREELADSQIGITPKGLMELHRLLGGVRDFSDLLLGQVA